MPASASSPGPGRQPVGLASSYLGPAAVAGLVSLSWFRPGRFIAAGDVSPFVRNSLAAEAGSLWNHQVTGAGNTSTDASRVVEVALIAAARSVGGSELLAQRVLFVAVMSFVVIGVVHAGRLLLRRRSALVVAGMLGACNPFVLLQLPNLIFPLAIGALAALVGELLGFVDGRPTTVLRLTVVSLPLAYLSINPPLLVMVVGAAATAVAVATVWGQGAAATWRTVLRSVPVIGAVHLFWLVPFVVVNLGGAEGVTFAAVTDIDAWNWVHGQSSLDRVVTLTAHWGWPFAEYFPWSERLDSMPWVALRWVLPGGAVLGAVTADRARRPVAVALLAVALVVVGLSQGLHPPAGPVNRLLHGHVPGWWLFRDPVSKFGPVLVVVYALLFALAAERLLAGGAGRRRALTTTGVVALTVAAVVHPHPLLTGEVAAADRRPLPSSHVAVPAAWFDLAAQVSASPATGKVAVLPLNDYYQVTTTWGYHGTDVIPQLFDRPVLQRLPGGYFAEIAGYEALLEATEAAIVAGDGTAADRLLDALGASHLVIRRDVAAGSSGRPAPDVGPLIDGANDVEGLQLVESNTAGVLFQRRAGSVVRAEPLAVTTAPGTEVDVVASGPGAVVPPTTVADRILGTSGAALSFESGADRYQIGLGATEELDVVVTSDRQAIRAELVDHLTIDGRSLPTGPAVTVDTGGRVVDALLVDEVVVPFEEGLALTLRPDEPVTALARAPARALGPPSPLRDCNDFDDRAMSELGFDAAVSERGVIVRAADHSACVVYDLGAGREPAELSLSMASLAGQPARLCVWSAAEGRCIVEDRAVERSWNDRTYLLGADARAGGLELYVYADGDGGATTEAGYRDVALSPLRELGSGSFRAAATIATVDLAEGDHEIEVTRPPVDVLGAFGPLGDCNRTDDRTPSEAGLAATVDGAAVTLEARAHAACVDAAIDAEPGERLIVSFDYRVEVGSGPRFCLWQSGIESCAPAPPIDGSGRYRAEVPTRADATALSLYLYADGDGGPTRIEYRQVAVTPARATQVVLDRIDDRRGTVPALDTEQRSTSSYRVDIDGADGPFVLVLAESYSPGWILSGLPDGWDVEHLLVDGYANGWRIEGRGDATVTLAYREAALTDAANQLSLLTAGMLIVVPGWWRWDRSRIGGPAGVAGPSSLRPRRRGARGCGVGASRPATGSARRAGPRPRSPR